MPDTGLTTTHRKYRTFLYLCILIYLLALLFRTLKIMMDPVLERDASLYLAWAENWVATGKYHYTFFDQVGPVAPLPLWLIKTAMLSGVGTEIAGRSISMFFGSMIPVIGFILTLRICRNIRIALLATVILIFHPDMVQYSGQPLRECPYVFFNGILLILLVEAVRNNRAVLWAAGGVMLSLAAYCRFEALEFAVLVQLILAGLWFIKKINMKDAVRNSAAFYTCFVLSYILLLTCVNFDYEFIARPLEHVMRPLEQFANIP